MGLRTILALVRVRGASGCNGRTGRDRVMGSCWEQTIVQTSPSLKINDTDLKPKALNEMKSGMGRKGDDVPNDLFNSRACFVFYHTSKELKFVLLRIRETCQYLNS